MNKIVADFFSLGIFSWLGRLLRGWRGLLIATSLGVTEYGQYTVFLLFTVYCSVFDIGLMANLEREIPHYEGLEEADQKQKAIDVGWSTYS
ncbi:MAG: hypothetical protein KC684_06560, partial [Candidatus Omnitrophica bacterium]|nr:hypothetical protein [Candidatus Omnitrophota bacterium]